MLSGVDTQSYMASVCGESNYRKFTSNSKSGQFFFFTHDGQFMVKTIAHSESKELQRSLRAYFEFLRKNPDSFIIRVFGFHRVKVPCVACFSTLVSLCPFVPVSL